MARGKKTGGRQRGTPNKITTDVKAAILAAFESVGGSDYLITVARDNPAVFCSLVAKVLPVEKNVNVNASHEHHHKHESVSDTARWVAEMLGERAGSPASKPLPN